jgi:hypothetical protein
MLLIFQRSLSMLREVIVIAVACLSIGLVAMTWLTVYALLAALTFLTRLNLKKGAKNEGA